MTFEGILPEDRVASGQRMLDVIRAALGLQYDLTRDQLDRLLCNNQAVDYDELIRDLDWFLHHLLMFAGRVGYRPPRFSTQSAADGR